MILKVKSLREADNYLTVHFQGKTFYSLTSFNKFVEEIKNGVTIEAPKDIDTTCHHCYTNFGTVYANKCVITEENIFFFNDEILIFDKKREKTDDIEFAYYIPKENTYASSNPLVYDCEQDIQFENYKED